MGVDRDGVRLILVDDDHSRKAAFNPEPPFTKGRNRPKADGHNR